MAVHHQAAMFEFLPGRHPALAQQLEVSQLSLGRELIATMALVVTSTFVVVRRLALTVQVLAATFSCLVVQL